MNRQLTRAQARERLLMVANEMGARTAAYNGVRLDLKHTAVYITDRAALAAGVAWVPSSVLRGWSSEVVEAYRRGYDESQASAARARA